MNDNKLKKAFDEYIMLEQGDKYKLYKYPNHQEKYLLIIINIHIKLKDLKVAKELIKWIKKRKTDPAFIEISSMVKKLKTK